MICKLPLTARPLGAPSAAGSCEHRSVAPDGRIVCRKIAWGENKVSPSLCRACPGQAVNCVHLRFSLRHSPPSSLLVRFSGRTEVWTDDHPALEFQQAACALQVMPLHSSRSCASCSMRQPLCAAEAPAQAAEAEPMALPRPANRGETCPAAASGKVVPFPGTTRPARSTQGGDHCKVQREAMQAIAVCGDLGEGQPLRRSS